MDKGAEQARAGHMTGMDPVAAVSAASEQIRELAAVTGVSLPEGDRLPRVHFGSDLNDVAKRLGAIVSRLDLFLRSGELVFYDEARREVLPMEPATFRTWINDHVLLWARTMKSDDADPPPIPMTLREADAKGILRSVPFRRGVRPLSGVNGVRLPVVRPCGKLELLPEGYDDQTEFFTIPGSLKYATDAPLAVGKVCLDQMDRQFPFYDERSRSAHRAAMLALFVKHIPGCGGLRPGFIYLGNQPGVGKSILAKACIYPVMGRAAAVKMKEGEQQDKELEAFARARVPYLFMDNIYGGINSSAIDQLLTSRHIAGRAMGGHSVFDTETTALLLVTGNGLELSPDAARRFTVIDLFERGELGERDVENRLDDDLLETDEWRAEMLACLFSLVRHWHEQGKPLSEIQIPTFERFTETVGGIVEAAGYRPPFEKAVIPDAISPGKEDFVKLLQGIAAEMGEEERRRVFPLADLARIARLCGAFEAAVGTREDGRRMMAKEEGLAGADRRLAEDRGHLTPKQKQAFGYQLKRQCGKAHKEVPGYVIEFGKRRESRTSEFTVSIDSIE